MENVLHQYLLFIYKYPLMLHQDKTKPLSINNHFAFLNGDTVLITSLSKLSTLFSALSELVTIYSKTSLKGFIVLNLHHSSILMFYKDISADGRFFPIVPIKLFKFAEVIFKVMLTFKQLLN